MKNAQKAVPLRMLMLLTVCVLVFTAIPALSFASEVSDENLFDKDDPYFTEGYNYVESTGEITNEIHSFMTGYIPVSPGDIMQLNLHSTQDAYHIKYALFDENKVWKSTFKNEYLSELTVRIFDPGFIRFSVYGLDFEKTITIYRTQGRVEAEVDNNDTIVVSQQNENVMVQTTKEDRSEDWVDVLDRQDPDFLDRKNFVYETGEIVDEYNSFISGFIPVAKGDTIVLDLNSSKTSPFVKYALYNEKKVWQKTVKLYDVSDLVVSITEPGFIRISVNNRMFINMASIYRRAATTLYADQQISNVILPAIAVVNGNRIAFNKNYMSAETIDLFDKNDPDFVMNKGYRQLTGDIVDDEGSFMSGFIPVVSGQVVVVNITKSSQFAKYILFDQNMNWISTSRVDNPTMLVIPITETGYFRFHGHDNAINGTSIMIPTVTKLDINAISDNLADRLQRLEVSIPSSKQVDVMLFMGQSNMAGRGATTEDHPEDAPAVIDGAGWEFRAITDPTKLYPIDKTFGAGENVTGAIDDKKQKTGGLVPSFVNAYYTHNGQVPVVCVSASEGATSLADWQPGTPRLEDAISRLNACVSWLESNGYTIRHRYMVWCHGETDVKQTEEWFNEQFGQMLDEMLSSGIEKCFLIRIGNANPVSEDFVNMMAYQTRLCKENRNVVMVSMTLSGLLNKGMMKDDLHYYQEGYNFCGEDAGVNAAYYVTTGKEPMIYDPQFQELYISEVN